MKDRTEASQTECISQETPSNPASNVVAKKSLPQRRFYACYLVLFYAGLTISSWVIQCILSRRPITAYSYDFNIIKSKNDGYRLYDSQRLESYRELYVKNARWFKAARVLSAIASTLTIPITSAVCAYAAVPFAQYAKHRKNLTMQQTMTLADRNWIRPSIVLKLILSKDGTQYGSPFLWLAIGLNLLGLIIAPLQQLYVIQKTIKTPAWPKQINSLTDIPDLFSIRNPPSDSGRSVVLLQSAMQSTTPTDYQPHLWYSGSSNCNSIDALGANLKEQCSAGGSNFANLSALDEPFLSQLPAGYNTGLIRQFVPRINSTVHFDEISPQEFPENCAPNDGNSSEPLFIHYTNSLDDGTWDLKICMPENVLRCPFSATRDRRGATEVLYLNLTLGKNFAGNNNRTFKVLLNTTVGYFELPNYFNGGNPGPLLAKDPNSICDSHCNTEGL